MSDLSQSVRRHPLLTWLAVLGLAILTHKLGWDFISVPLTLCVLCAGFVITQAECFQARRNRRKS